MRSHRPCRKKNGGFRIRLDGYWDKRLPEYRYLFCSTRKNKRRPSDYKETEFVMSPEVPGEAEPVVSVLRRASADMVPVEKRKITQYQIWDSPPVYANAIEMPALGFVVELEAPIPRFDAESAEVLEILDATRDQLSIKDDDVLRGTCAQETDKGRRAGGR